MEGDDLTFAKKPIGAVLKDALLALVCSIIVNTVVYFVGGLLNAIPGEVLVPDQGGQPLTLMPVIIASIVGVVLGTVGFLIIRAITINYIKVFRIVAIIFLIMSFSNPFFINGAPMKMIVTLNAMHIVVALFVIFFLTRKGNVKHA